MSLAQSFLNLIGAIARQFHKPQRNTWGFISPQKDISVSILSSIESLWQKNETFVLGIIVNIKSGVAVLEKDIAAANVWIVSHATTITADIESIVGIVQAATAAGIKLPSGVSAAVQTANEAVAALNAYATAAGSGTNTANALIAGYTAAKQASAAHSAAALALAGA